MYHDLASPLVIKPAYTNALRVATPNVTYAPKGLQVGSNLLVLRTTQRHSKILANHIHVVHLNRSASTIKPRNIHIAGKGYTNVNHDRLKVVVFPISLVGNARKWFDEIKGSVTTWVDLTERFFGKYYSPSRTYVIVGTKNDGHEGVIDDGFFNLEEANNDDEQEIGEIFRIETNLFNYETPLCMKFNEFNYLLKVDPKVFTYDVERTMTYEDYKNEFNDELKEPCSEGGVPYEIGNHICEPFRFKNGKAKWPTCSSSEDGFCNCGELPGMVRIGCMTYFQDHEWYNDLMDGSLKNEALELKAIYVESWGDASQSIINLCAWLKRSFENFHELDYELLVKLQDYWDNEKYVAIKEDEYDDLTNTNEDACRAYQEIFRNMDEGWLVKRDE
ncbi:hypothetical protein Tco_0413038 [Tanacetum coccineum]